MRWFSQIFDPASTPGIEIYHIAFPQIQNSRRLGHQFMRIDGVPAAEQRQKVAHSASCGLEDGTKLEPSRGSRTFEDPEARACLSPLRGSGELPSHPPGSRPGLLSAAPPALIGTAIEKSSACYPIARVSIERHSRPLCLSPVFSLREPAAFLFNSHQ